MEIYIQKARPSDLQDGLLAIRHSKLGQVYFETDDDILGPLGVGLATEEVYVARTADDEFLGLIWFVLRGAFHSFPYVHIIAVKKEYRGQGVGQKLLSFFEKIVFEDASKAFLVVSDFNPDAKRLYLRLGYRQVGILPGLYREGVTEYLMMKVRPS